MAAHPNTVPSLEQDANATEQNSLVIVDPREPGHTESLDDDKPHSVLTLLPINVSVAVPIRGFRVRDLVTLEPDRILSSDWSHAEDLPLTCGDVQLLWTEFEVVDQKIAARVTRLA